MGRSTSGCDQTSTGPADEQPEHAATPSNFYMDTYEVNDVSPGYDCGDVDVSFLWTGATLSLSALTVKSHLSRIGRKLGTGDRAQMVALAMRAGVIR